MSLLELYKRFAKATIMLTNILESTVTSCVESSIDEKVLRLSREMCVVRLHDTWARFCRELVIISAYAKPFTAQGQRVQRAPGIKKRNDVILKLLSTYRKKRFEPRWHDSFECLDAAKRLKVSNFSVIISGLGLSSSPVEDLTHLRNFFAHRSYENAQRVAGVATKLNLSTELRPDLIIVEIVPPGLSVFRKWVKQLHIMALYSIK
ncbi:hypothetical protein ES707_12913 [subsurface metagenome]